jgi:ribosomal-protein-alanine N-acetyltransferase
LNLDKAFATFPRLQTRRLALRQMTAVDTDALFAIYSEWAVVAGHGIPPFTQTAQATERIEWYQRAFAEKRAIRWAITRQGEDQLIGTCGFHHLVKQHFRGQIGYELAPAYWRQGIMTEALQSIVRFGFEEMGFHRIEAIVDPENVASANLLRKIGFQEEGFLRQRFYDEPEFVDDWFFSMLKPDFEKCVKQW